MEVYVYEFQENSSNRITARSIWGYFSIGIGLATVVLLMFLPWHPPVGVYIAILAFLGVCVPLIRGEERISRNEKAVWTGVMLVLVLLEVTSIYKEQNEHDTEQSAARKEQLEGFAAIAKGIDSNIQNSQQQFSATMSRFDSTATRLEKVQNSQERTVELSEKNLEYATGGDAYCYLWTTPPFPPNLAPPGRWPLYVQNSGDVPLPYCDFQVMAQPVVGDSPEEVVKKFQSSTLLRFPNLPPTHGGIPFPGASVVPGVPYSIVIQTPTHSFYENLTFTKDPSVGGGYKTRWMVFPSNADKNTKPLLDSN